MTRAALITQVVAETSDKRRLSLPINYTNDGGRGAV